MLQFRRFDADPVLPDAPPDGDLWAHADRAIEALRERRHARASRAGPLWRTLSSVDRAMRTRELERLDQDGVSDQRKLGIVEALHDLNTRLFSYRRFLSAAAPLIRRINLRDKRPARLVELASGYGEFTLRAPAMARSMGLDIEVTGTDIVPAYVERGAREAARRGVRASFEVLNAFEMEVERDRFDVALIAQSMHHFTPGQLATVIAACRGKIRTGFVGIDGHRSLLLLWAVPAYALLFGRPARLDFAHDAFLSGRKFYTEPELLHLARVGAGGAPVSVRTSHPGYSVVTVDFEGRP